MHRVSGFFITVLSALVLLYLGLWRRRGAAPPAFDDSLWLLLTLLLMALLATGGLVFYLFST